MADESGTGPVSGISRSTPLRRVRDSRRRHRPAQEPEERTSGGDEATSPDALEGPAETGGGKRKGRFVDEHV